MLDEVLFKPCSKCGFPRLVSKLLRWHGDGTIGLSIGDYHRMIMLSTGVWNGVVKELEDNLGIPVGHIFYNTHSLATAKAFNSMTQRFKALDRLKRFKMVKSIILQLYRILDLVVAYAAMEKMEHETNGTSTALVRNPFNLDIVGATVVCCLEDMDGVPYKNSWKKLSDEEYIIEVSPASEKERLEILERLETELELVKPETGHNPDLPVCPKCKVPLDFSRTYEWHIDKGEIINRKNGERFCIFFSHTGSPVFRELSVELGEDVYDFLDKAQCEWTAKHIGYLGLPDKVPVEAGEGLDRYCEEYLKEFPLNGFGKPISFNADSATWSVTIENPFDNHWVKGTLLGFYEACWKRKGSASIEPGESGRTTFIMKPASGS